MLERCLRLKIALFLSLICILGACSSLIPFDKQKWIAYDDPAFPPTGRAAILKDLLQNHQLVGLTYAELKEKLGAPDYETGHAVTYKIVLDYEDLDPVYSKNLELGCTTDSIINAFNVVEWKAK